MKAPAIRVLTARITAKVNEEYQAARLAQSAANIAYNADKLAVFERINTLIAANANRDIAKYVAYTPGKGSYGDPIYFRGNEAFDAMCQAVREANPFPKEPRTEMIEVRIASLNMVFNVPKVGEKKWAKFVSATDLAFLEDDAKKILKALEIL